MAGAFIYPLSPVNISTVFAVPPANGAGNVPFGNVWLSIATYGGLSPSGQANGSFRVQLLDFSGNDVFNEVVIAPQGRSFVKQLSSNISAAVITPINVGGGLANACVMIEYQ